MGISQYDFNIIRKLMGSFRNSQKYPDLRDTLGKFVDAAEQLRSAESARARLGDVGTVAKSFSDVTSGVDKSLDIISKIRRMATPAAKPSLQKRIVESAKEYALPAALVLGAGATAKNFIVDPIVDSAKSEIAFKQMPSAVPQLENKDTDEMRRYFNVIKTFSPKSATNPLVAGALVNKMMEFGGVDHKLIQDLSTMQKNINDNNFALSIAPRVYEGAVDNVMKSSVDDPFMYGAQYKALGAK